MNTRSILLVSALLLPISSWADQLQQAVEMPSAEVPPVVKPTADKIYIKTTQTAKMTATVETINHETREVTLRGEDGTVKNITVGEEARNLGQVKVGDIVHSEFVQQLIIEVMADDGSELGGGTMAAVARAKEGDMPGVAAMDTTIVSARVEEINIEANTFKLKWPDETVEEFVAQDPENLKKADVGDLVVITQTEAVAIVVEQANAE